MSFDATLMWGQQGLNYEGYGLYWMVRRGLDYRADLKI